MWTALPLKSWPPNAIFFTVQSPRRHSVAVHNRQNREEITALKSKEPRRQNSGQSETKTKPLPPSEKQKLQDQQKQRQLSGADVLIALRRAAPHKSTKKNDRREIAAAPKDGNDTAGRDTQGATNFSNIRSLLIKPEWSGRLEELERRLQELAHR